jgi:hypothetical protein
MRRNIGTFILVLAAGFSLFTANPQESYASEGTQSYSAKPTKRVKKAPYGYHGRTWLLKERILRK